MSNPSSLVVSGFKAAVVVYVFSFILCSWKHLVMKGVSLWLALWKCVCFQSDKWSSGPERRSGGSLLPRTGFEHAFLAPIGFVATHSHAKDRIMFFEKCVLFYPRWCYRLVFEERPRASQFWMRPMGVFKKDAQEHFSLSFGCSQSPHIHPTRTAVRRRLLGFITPLLRSQAACLQGI